MKISFIPKVSFCPLISPSILAPPAPPSTYTQLEYCVLLHVICTSVKLLKICLGHITEVIKSHSSPGSAACSWYVRSSPSGVRLAHLDRLWRDSWLREHSECLSCTCHWKLNTFKLSSKASCSVRPPARLTSPLIWEPGCCPWLSVIGFVTESCDWVTTSKLCNTVLNNLGSQNLILLPCRMETTIPISPRC